MKKTLAWVIIAFALSSCKDDAKTETPATTTTEAAKPADRDYQLGDNKYVELCKTASAALEHGDIDSWITIFADNAVYHWNNYDSLSGRAAIADYWKKRWAEALDSMSFKNQYGYLSKLTDLLLKARQQAIMPSTGMLLPLNTKPANR